MITSILRFFIEVLFIVLTIIVCGFIGLYVLFGGLGTIVTLGAFLVLDTIEDWLKTISKKTKGIL